MRKLFVPVALVLSVALGSTAFAATKPAATKTTATSQSMATSKNADCLKQWKAQKKHDQTRKAFLAACEKA